MKTVRCPTCYGSGEIDCLCSWCRGRVGRMMRDTQHPPMTCFDCLGQGRLPEGTSLTEIRDTDKEAA